MYIIGTSEIIEAQDAYVDVKVVEINVQFPTLSTFGIRTEANPLFSSTKPHYKDIWEDNSCDSTRLTIDSPNRAKNKIVNTARIHRFLAQIAYVRRMNIPRTSQRQKRPHKVKKWHTGDSNDICQIENVPPHGRHLATICYIRRMTTNSDSYSPLPARMICLNEIFPMRPLNYVLVTDELTWIFWVKRISSTSAELQ